MLSGSGQLFWGAGQDPQEPRLSCLVPHQQAAATDPWAESKGECHVSAGLLTGPELSVAPAKLKGDDGICLPGWEQQAGAARVPDPSPLNRPRGHQDPMFSLGDPRRLSCNEHPRCAKDKQADLPGAATQQGLLGGKT